MLVRACSLVGCVLVMACSSAKPAEDVSTGGNVQKAGGSPNGLSAGGRGPGTLGGARAAAAGTESAGGMGALSPAGGTDASEPASGGTAPSSAGGSAPSSRGGSPSTGGMSQALAGGTTQALAGGTTQVATGGATQTSNGGTAGYLPWPPPVIGGRVAAGGTTGPGGTTANTGGTGVAGTVTIGQTRTGEGTYYGATGDGNCSFGPSPNDLMVAALNQTDYSMAAWCGACAEVTGPAGQVRVRIVDRCPECKPGDLDFSQEAFEKISPLVAGRVPISWIFVACDVTGPVSYRFKEGSSAYWTALQVLNHRLPVTQLDFSSDGGSTWNPTVRQEYNYFLAASGFGVLPVRVRITATDGQTLIDPLPLPESELVVAGQGQFQ